MWPTPEAPIDPVRRLPEKATQASANGSRAVCTNARVLWKGPRAIFSGFYRGRKRHYRAKPADAAALARKSAKAQLWRQDKTREALREHHGPAAQKPGAERPGRRLSPSIRAV